MKTLNDEVNRIYNELADLECQMMFDEVNRIRNELACVLESVDRHKNFNKSTKNQKNI